MENPEVAQIFDEVADLLEIQGANPFRVRAYRGAGRTIRDLSEPLAQMPPDKLTALAGIGKDLAGKITTILQTKELPLRKELYSQVPPGLRDLLRVPNLGPKRALFLHQQLHITSLDKLRQAAAKHRLQKLRGFGSKTEEKILQALDGLEQTGRRFLLAEAKVYADSVVCHLQQTAGLEHLEVAGSFRRRKETVADLDLLACCADPGPVMDRLGEYEGVAAVVARGQTKMTVRLRNGLQMDLRVVPPEAYGSALQYFTGSKEHSILLRRRAQERGLKLNEYGVFKGSKRIAGTTEEEVYKAVDVPWIPPSCERHAARSSWHSRAGCQSCWSWMTCAATCTCTPPSPTAGPRWTKWSPLPRSAATATSL
jgi:DNA polymerase (family 10)